MLQSVAAVITALGVVFAGISLRGSLILRHRQFESLYVQRYWDLIDGFSPNIVLGRSAEDLAPDEEKQVLLYLRLCEDQLEMRHLGWITRSTYKVWADGIYEQLKQWPFAQVMQELVENAKGRELEFLQQLQCNGHDYDPLSKNLIVSWLRGI